MLDPIGGAKGLRCLAPTGRLVVFGFWSAASGKPASWWAGLKSVLSVPWLEFNPFTLMNENRAIVGVNLGHMWGEKERLARWMTRILAWCAEGKVRPTVDRTFRFAEAAQAHHHLQDRKNFGKVVLVP